jgi:hypothetical protein
VAYVLTEHARDALEKRSIALEWMESVLAYPELIEPDTVDPELEHRLGRVKEKGDRILRVIVNVKRRPRRVVTVFFDRRRSII